MSSLDTCRLFNSLTSSCPVRSENSGEKPRSSNALSGAVVSTREAGPAEQPVSNSIDPTDLPAASLKASKHRGNSPSPHLQSDYLTHLHDSSVLGQVGRMQVHMLQKDVPSGSKQKREKKYLPMLDIDELDDFLKLVYLIKEKKQTSPGYFRRSVIIRHCGHFTAFNLYIEAGAVSVIGVESARVMANSYTAKMTSIPAQLIPKHISDARFMMIEGNVQKALTGCDVFSLNFALEMDRHRSFFDNLHQQHLAGQLDKKINSSFYIPSESVNPRLLPPVFMKYSQSRTRVQQYFEISTLM